MKWKYLLWLLPVVLIFSAGKPKKYEINNRWDNIRWVSESEFNRNPDTLFVVVTNRIYQPGHQQSFADQRDPEGIVHYVLITFSKGEWRMVMKSSLMEAIRNLPKRDFVIYVEGMGKTYPMDLQRASMMTAQYGVNVIQFEYPSIDPDRSVFANFYFAYRNAKDAAPEYAAFLHELEKVEGEAPELFEGNHISLFHHSMGNRMVKYAIEDSLINFNGQKIFDNVILNAACVPSKNHKQWVEEIDFSNQVYINYNKKDFQLRGARLITFDRMLGSRFGKPLADNAFYINFTDLVGNRHSNFLNMEGREDISPECHAYYDQVLHGKKLNLSDTSFFAREKNSTNYMLK